MNKISIGPTTIAGLATAAITVLPPAINQIIAFIENNQARFSGSEKLMAITGAVVLTITLAGRFAQALKAK